VHAPALQEESVQKYLESVERDSGKKGSSSASTLSMPNVRIASIDVVYRPQNGFHPMLQQVLLRGRIPSEDGVWTAATEDTEEDEEEDDGNTLPSNVATGKTLRDHTRAYIASRQLLQVNPEQPQSKPEVRVDEVLRHLWDGQTAPYTIPIDELDKKILTRFCPMHLIRYAPLTTSAGKGCGAKAPAPTTTCLPSYLREKLRNGKPAMVHIYTEKRCGNKIVTIVRGLDALGFSLEAVSFGWRSQFATSVNIVDPMKEVHGAPLKSGTKLRREIVLQGPFKTELEAHLSGALGVPKSLLSLTRN